MESQNNPDRVEIVPYDPAWPRRFLEIRAELEQILGETATRIEHVGSTAVEGLAAKPVVDVLVGVPDHDVARTIIVPALLKAGYFECYWRFDDPPGHFQCVKRDPQTFKRLVHVHLAPKLHPVWLWTVFRDYVRANPAEAARYEELKVALAEKYSNDREAYTKAKAEYVNEITQMALAEKRR